eukprot:TRINITY_DN89452_c0_g1_i1.p1 TRINITY_DN89452_c0_g1~~TRINITY_DN89452_c0_g1_i1.p1  ORF type:complete len:550 (+),score=158.39 TRINITY_DN89452_c0_g1_i1:141-1790(+)
MTAPRTFQDYQREKRAREWKEKVEAKKASMGNAERVKTATEYKQIGNDKFKSGNLLEAKDYYREAIVFVEDLVDARRQERNDLLVPLYSNLAEVEIRLGEFGGAEDVASKALVIADVPRNAISSSLKAKACFRRGLARRHLGKLEEARTDLQTVLQLEPTNDKVSEELAVVRSKLAEKQKEAQAAWGGFLNKEAARRESKEERERREEEKRRKAEEQRKERLARAEQRQQMQGAFEKLSKGSMLYEAREKEMEPVRAKEKEKQQTLELEQNLLNIIDESKGKEKTENFDEFMKKKEERAVEQYDELGQKKKVLDKIKKEEQWAEDDIWKDQREEHRKQIQEDGRRCGAKQMWEAKQVDRWCQQRVRDLLVPASVESEDELPSKLVALFEEELSGHYVLRALITDVLKITGDASVVRLNLHKPPLYYFDYFLKLDWEVHMTERDSKSYRTADELINIAAHSDDNKAPPSVAKNRILGGTFKIREFSSEETPGDGKWPLAVKVKRRYSGSSTDAEALERITKLAEQLRDKLLEKTQALLCQWVTEYQEHWG